MNLSVVMMYLIVDSIINAFSLSLRPFYPKRNVSTIVASLFNQKRLMLLIRKRFFFDLSDLSSGERSEYLFQNVDFSCKMGLGSLENCF